MKLGKKEGNSEEFLVIRGKKGFWVPDIGRKDHDGELDEVTRKNAELREAKTEEEAAKAENRQADQEEEQTDVEKEELSVEKQEQEKEAAWHQQAMEMARHVAARGTGHVQNAWNWMKEKKEDHEKNRKSIEADYKGKPNPKLWAKQALAQDVSLLTSRYVLVGFALLIIKWFDAYVLGINNLGSHTVLVFLSMAIIMFFLILNNPSGEQYKYLLALCLVDLILPLLLANSFVFNLLPASVISSSYLILLLTFPWVAFIVLFSADLSNHKWLSGLRALFLFIFIIILVTGLIRLPIFTEAILKLDEQLNVQFENLPYGPDVAKAYLKDVLYKSWNFFSEFILQGGIVTWASDVFKQVVSSAVPGYGNSKETKEPEIGLALKEPSVPNRISYPEKRDLIPVRTLLELKSTQPTDVELSCKSKKIGEQNQMTHEDIFPSGESLKGSRSIKKDVTCNAINMPLGPNEVVITAKATNFVTVISLTQHFVGKKEVDDIITSPENIELDRDIVLAKEFSEYRLGTPSSEYNPGPVKGSLYITSTPVEGIDTGTIITLVPAVGKLRREGKIDQIKGIRIDYPEGFEPAVKGCEAYNKVEDGILRLKPAYLIGVDFDKQYNVPLEVCSLKVEDATKILSAGRKTPNPRDFKVTVLYDYSVEANYIIQNGEEKKGLFGGGGISKFGILPVDGEVSSCYGGRAFDGNSEFHDGIDFAVPVGTDVKAVESGKVIDTCYYSSIDTCGGFGSFVAIEHNDKLFTSYNHLSEVLVNKGDSVSKGQVIARSGNTGRSSGPHLHLSVYTSKSDVSGADTGKNPSCYLPPTTGEVCPMDDCPKLSASGNYREMYNNMQYALTPSKQSTLNFATNEICDKNKARYQAVEEKTGVPWYIVAAIHYRESTFNFNTYLHNGDPLGAPTVHVPAGIYFENWEDAAVHAINSKKSVFEKDLFEGLEAYNGFGYRDRGVNSPYLWSGSTYYDKGKYVADGVYDPNVEDQQLGTLVILKKMEEIGCAKV